MKNNFKLLMTEQRQVILEELKKTTSHPTADELFQMVRRRMPRISLGTVYRNLEVLSENGIIQKLEWAGNQKRYDGNFNNHYHIRCAQCNRVEDVMVEPLSVIEEKFREATDYEIMGHRLEVIGLCSKCREEVPKRRPSGFPN